MDCDYSSNSTEIVHENGCWDLKQEECYSQDAWIQKYEEGDVIKSGLFSNLGDIWGGVVSLFTSLAILCIALYLIVSTLHKIVLQGRGRGRILDIIVNVLTKNGAASILFGMLLTISVQCFLFKNVIFGWRSFAKDTRSPHLHNVRLICLFKLK